MVNLQSHKSEFEEFSKKILEALKKSYYKNFTLRQPQNLQDGILSSISQDFIKKETSYIQLESILSDSEIVEKYGSGSADYLLSRLIYKMIVQNKNSDSEWFQYDQTIFEKIFLSFIEELSNPYWTFSALCIVLNFQSNLQSINIDDNIKIEKITTTSGIMDFMGWSKNQYDAYVEREKEIIFRHHFVFMITEKIKKEAQNCHLSNSPTAYSMMENLLTTLRLYKSGDVSTSDLFYSRQSEFFTSVGLGYSWISATPFLYTFGNGYLLTGEEIPDFIKFRIKINNFITISKNFNHILLSLRYFNSTYRAIDQYDDRLIDCITSLEALFKIDSELAFKLAYRISYLLSKSDKERMEIFSDIKKFYNTRNHLVHGSSLNENDKRNINNVEKLVNYARRCIIAFINLTLEGKLSNQFYEEIDVMLMNDIERTNIQKISFQK